MLMQGEKPQSILPLRLRSCGASSSCRGEEAGFMQCGIVFRSGALAPWSVVLPRNMGRRAALNGLRTKHAGGIVSLPINCNSEGVSVWKQRSVDCADFFFSFLLWPAIVSRRSRMAGL
jgi:hypothetical protein